MKKIIIAMSLVFCVSAASAQTNPFPTIDSLIKYINKYIRNSAVDAFTNLRLNTAMIGVTRFAQDAYNSSPALKPDSVVLLQDSIMANYRGGIVVRRDTIRGLSGSGSTAIANAGSAFRLFVQSAQTIKTVSGSTFITLDSATANTIKWTLDSNSIHSRLYNDARYVMTFDTSRNSTTATFTSASNNVSFQIKQATISKAGLMSALDKAILDSTRAGLIADSIAIVRHAGTDSVFIVFTQFGSLTSTSYFSFIDSTGSGTDATKVPLTRSLTINGTTQDLSANRTFTVTDANLSATDITTNNATTSKHGFLPKLPGGSTNFLREDGTFAATPAGGTLTKTAYTDSVKFNGTYVFRDSVQHGITRTIAARSVPTNIRNDAGSLIVFRDGTWGMAYTAYGVSSGDVSSAVIVFRRSTDYGLTWSASDTAVFNVANGAYIPSLILGAGDTLYMLYDHQPGALTSQIKKVKLAPPYTVGTWTSPTLVYGDGTKFFAPAADKITRLNSGALLYAFCQNINSGTNTDYSSAFGAYAGRALISYDNAISWRYVPTIDIRSPDSLYGESGFVQRDDDGGTIIAYGRTRSNDVYEVKANLSDTLFGSNAVPINLGAPNTSSAIKYIKKLDLFVAVHNSLDLDFGRHRMWLSVSRDGYTWTRKVRVDSITGQKFFEPFFSFINNEVVIGYSTQDDATGDSSSLIVQRVPFYYLQDAAPTGNNFEKIVINKVNIFDDPNLFEGYYGRISRTAASIILSNQTSSFSSGESWWRYTSNGIAHLTEYFVPTNNTAFKQNHAWGVYGSTSTIGDAYVMHEWQNNGTQKVRIFGDGQVTGTAPGSGSNDNHFITSAWARANITGGGGGTVSDTTGPHWFTNGADTTSIIPTGTGGGDATIKTYSGSTLGTLNLQSSTIQIVTDNPLFRFNDNVLGTVATIQNTGYKLVFNGSSGFENFQFNKQIHGLHGGSVDTRYDINAGSFIYNYNGFGSNVDPFSFAVTGSTGAMGSWYGGSDAAGYSMRLTNAGLLSLGGDGTASARFDNFGKSRFRDTARLDSVFSYNTNINSRLKINSLAPKGYIDSLIAIVGTPTLQSVLTAAPNITSTTTTQFGSTNWTLSQNSTGRLKLSGLKQDAIAYLIGHGADSAPVNVTRTTVNAFIGNSSGTATLSLTNTTNITSTTADPSHWTIQDGYLTIYGSFSFVTTLAVASEVQIDFTSIVSDDVSTATDVSGTGSPNSATAQNVYIEGDAATDRASVKFLGLSVGGSGKIYYSLRVKIISP